MIGVLFVVGYLAVVGVLFYILSSISCYERKTDRLCTWSDLLRLRPWQK